MFESVVRNTKIFMDIEVNAKRDTKDTIKATVSYKGNTQVFTLYNDDPDVYLMSSKSVLNTLMATYNLGYSASETILETTGIDTRKQVLTVMNKLAVLFSYSDLKDLNFDLTILG